MDLNGGITIIEKSGTLLDFNSVPSFFSLLNYSRVLSVVAFLFLLLLSSPGLVYPESTVAFICLPSIKSLVTDAKRLTVYDLKRSTLHDLLWETFYLALNPHSHPDIVLHSPHPLLAPRISTL